MWGSRGALRPIWTRGAATVYNAADGGRVLVESLVGLTTNPKRELLRIDTAGKL